MKRCIETIISKINIHILSQGDNSLSFNLEDLNLPVTLNEKHIEILLKKDSSEDKPPYGMYLWISWFKIIIKIKFFYSYNIYYDIRL